MQLLSALVCACVVLANAASRAVAGQFKPCPRAWTPTSSGSARPRRVGSPWRCTRSEGAWRGCLETGVSCSGQGCVCLGGGGRGRREEMVSRSTQGPGVCPQPPPPPPCSRCIFRWARSRLWAGNYIQACSVLGDYSLFTAPGRLRVGLRRGTAGDASPPPLNCGVTSRHVRACGLRWVPC